MTTQITSIDLSPPTLKILSNELFPFTVEWVDLIGRGNNVTSPVGYLYDDSNGMLVTNGFQNNFGANGTQAQYILDGTKLLVGHSYTAILFVTVGTQNYAQRLKVSVPN